MASGATEQRGELASLNVDAPVDPTGHAAETTCLNCNEPLTGAFCRRCGQHAHPARTLGALWHDFTHGILHLDGKLLQTLPLLALRPGELTRRYASGERRKFVSPIAMFLFSVFALFLVMQVFHVQLGQIDPEETASAALFNAERTLTRIAGTDSEASADLELAGGLATVSRRAPDGESQSTPPRANPQERARQALPILRDAMQKWGAPSMAHVEADEADTLGLLPLVEKVVSDPALMLYKFQANSYKFSWALIPLSVPFIWLLFARKPRFTIYDHTIFVTYSLAFATLLVTVLVLAGQTGIGSDVLAVAMLIVMPIHQFMQLRGAYSLRKRSALWRLVVLQVVIMIVIGLFATLIFGLGLL